MARFYGLLIIRAMPDPSQPAANAVVPQVSTRVLAQETLTIGSDLSCDIQLRGLQARHALLLCDFENDTDAGNSNLNQSGFDSYKGGISLINISSTQITIEQRLKAELQTDSNGANGIEQHVAQLSRQLTLQTGEICPINSETLIDLGRYQLEVRLAPGMYDRPSADKKEEVAFRLEVGRTLLPVEAAPAALAQAAQPDYQAELLLRPGEEQALDLKVTSVARNVQSITFRSPRRIDDNGDQLPTPSWIALASTGDVNLQTSTQFDRATTNNALVLTPPRRPTSTAGRYELEIAAHSSLALAKSDETSKICITLLPYVELAATMRQRKLTALRRGNYRLEIQNNSNWNVSIRLDLSNHEDALEYDITASTHNRTHQVERKNGTSVFVIAPIVAGEQIELALTAWPKHRWPLGRTRSLPFTLRIIPDINDRGDWLEQQVGSAAGYKLLQEQLTQNDRSVAPITIEAELVQRRLPYLPLLILTLLLIVVVVLAIPAIPLTFIDLVKFYHTTRISSGTLVQPFNVTGQVVAGNAATLRAPLAGELTQLSVPANCQPSITIVSLEGCRFDQGGPIALISIAPQLGQLDEMQRQLDKTSQTITNTEVLWRVGNDKARVNLDRARQELSRVGPAGGESELRQADDQLQTAAANLDDVRNQMSQEKTKAELTLAQATADLQAAQHAVEVALHNRDWVDQHGTHPTEQYMMDGQLVPRPLTTAEKQQFREAVTPLEHARNNADQAFAIAQNAVKIAKQHEISQIQQAERLLNDARIRHDAAAQGTTAEVLAAETALNQAEVEATTANQQGADQLATALDTARTAFNQLRQNFPLILDPPDLPVDDPCPQPSPPAEIRKEVELVESQIIVTQRLIARGDSPTQIDGQGTLATQKTIKPLDPIQASMFRNSKFDEELNIQQRDRQAQIDALLLAIHAVRDLSTRVRDWLTHIQRITLCANSHVVQVHAQVGDQIVAGSPLLTYYVNKPKPQVIASIDPKQIMGLQAHVTISITSTNPLTHDIALLPPLLNSAGQPQTISQTIILTPEVTLPLYTPVTVHMHRVILLDAPLMVPERAIFGDGTNTTVIVRRPLLLPRTFLLTFLPGLLELQFDEQIPVRIDGRANGLVAITVISSDGVGTAPDRLQQADQILVR